VDYLNGVVNLSVSDDRLVLLEENRLNTLVVPYKGGHVTPLELRPRGVLFFQQILHLERPKTGPKVILDECAYTFVTDADDEDSWVFRYEYNRSGYSKKPHSHFHVNAVHPKNEAIHFDRLHFPAGRLSLEQILGHLVLEHGVELKTAKAWGILEKSHKGFSRRRTDLEDAPFP